MNNSSPIKNIIALFDFSECSANAIKYALQIAHATGAEVHILHAFESLKDEISTNQTNLLTIKYELEQKMNADLQPLLKDSTLTVQQNCKIGHLISETKKLASRIDADLIIMGTYSKNPLKRMLMGSSAIDVMENLDVPVLFIPIDYEYREIREVCFSTNYHSGSIPSIHKLIELFSPFEINLHLLHVQTDDKKNSRKATFQRLLNEDSSLKNVEIEEVKAPTLWQGTISCSQQHQMDLLAMSNKKRKGLAAIFGTTPQEEALYTKLPLLVIPRASIVIDISLDETEIP